MFEVADCFVEFSAFFVASDLLDLPLAAEVITGLVLSDDCRPRRAFAMPSFFTMNETKQLKSRKRLSLSFDSYDNRFQICLSHSGSFLYILRFSASSSRMERSFIFLFFACSCFK